MAAYYHSGSWIHGVSAECSPRLQGSDAQLRFAWSPSSRRVEIAFRHDRLWDSGEIDSHHKVLFLMPVDRPAVTAAGLVVIDIGAAKQLKPASGSVPGWFTSLS